jgi:hypothetical protein
MARTDIPNPREAEIDTIAGILDVLKNYSDKDFEGDTFLQDACKDALGEDWELYKGKREEIIDALEKMEPELKVEDAQITAEEIKMGVKALSSEELKSLLEAWDKESSKQEGTPRGKKAVEDFIQGQERLTAQQKEQAIKELWPVIEKVEIKKEVKLIVGKEVEEQVVDKVVEAIVEEKPIEIRGEELGQKKSKEEAQEIREEVELLKKEVADQRRVEEQVDTLVRETTARYREIIGEVTEKEQVELERSVKREIEDEVARPWNEADDNKNPIKITKDSAGKITVTVNGEETTLIYENKATRKGGVVSRPISQEKVQELTILEKKVTDKVGELRKSTDSAGEELRAIRKSLLENTATIKQVRMVRPLVLTKPEYEEVKNTMVNNGFTEKQAAEVAQEAKVVAGSIVNGGKEVAKLPAKLQKLNSLLGGKVKAVTKLSETATKLEGQFQSIGAVQKIAGIQARINALNPLRLVGKMVPGMEKFAASFGTQTTAEMAAALASQIATHGLKEGTMVALRSILATGKVATATAAKAGATAAATTAAGTAGSTAAVTAAGAASAVPVVGWVVALIIIVAQAAMWLGGKIIKTGKAAIDSLLKKMNWDLEELGLKDKFGGLMGGGMELAIYGAAALFAFFAFIQARAIATGAIAAVVIFGFSLVTGSSSLTLNQILPWVANRYVGGGYCIYIGPEEEVVPGGDINCDTTVPDQTGTNVNKQNFISVAERWRTGGGKNAELCFNDVVKKAKEAGKNPDYALWAWLHESGASNYDGFSVELADFGIIYEPYEDFNAQIGAFLKLDPASGCPALAQQDYWLAFSTNYLSGRCDPDEVVDGTTGRAYVEELRSTWGWISSAPLPDSINFDGGSGNEGSGGSGSESGPDLVVVIDDGDRYLCEVMAESTGEIVGDVPLPPLDPNIKIPEGCPNGLPIQGNRQSIISNITQGPSCAKYSHRSMANAVDFGILGTIISTHNGIARAGSNAIYGYYVDVTGVCGGITFSTRYAHMPSLPFTGTKEVKKGDPIGQVNNTGSSTGNHLHYDIRGGSLPLPISNYLGLSKDLKGCCDRASCAQ